MVRLLSEPVSVCEPAAFGGNPSGRAVRRQARETDCDVVPVDEALSAELVPKVLFFALEVMRSLVVWLRTTMLRL
jgi:hypothetical protein